jgi:hypothetical protein
MHLSGCKRYLYRSCSRRSCRSHSQRRTSNSCPWPHWPLPVQKSTAGLSLALQCSRVLSESSRTRLRKVTYRETRKEFHTQRRLHDVGPGFKRCVLRDNNWHWPDHELQGADTRPRGQRHGVTREGTRLDHTDVCTKLQSATIFDSARRLTPFVPRGLRSNETLG